MNARKLTALSALAILAACQGAVSQVEVAEGPQDRFWANLSSHCGNAYRGQLVSTDAVDAEMRGADMVMHVRECSPERIAIPFHIRQAGGEWDRSRTWVLTRTAQGLRLKHDHRHADGESDAVTMYGGDTAQAGTATRQDFPVDAESIALFRQEGLDASVTNVWRVTVDDAAQSDAEFSYALIRRKATGAPQDRDFRVVFDAANPVPAPPPPWGFEG